jgi:hypothetical protein
MRRRNATTTTVFLLLAVLFLALAFPTSFPNPASAAETVDGWVRHTIDASLDGAWGICVHDIDEDGNPDVVATGGDAADVVWYEAPDNPAGAWRKHTIDANLYYANMVYVHDLDDDGDPDVLATGWAANDLVWYEAPGDPTRAWTKHTIDANLYGARAISVHDFDADGNPDVLAGAGKADTVVWYEAPDDPAGAWTKHTIDPSIDYPNMLCLYDIDADGNMDVIATAWAANVLVWYEAPDDPSGAWTKHTIDANLKGADSLQVHDFDADGNPDVVVTGGNPEDDYATGVAWYEAPDDPSGAWTKHSIDNNLRGATSVHVYDIDADGNADVLATAWAVDDVVWYEAPDNPSAVWTKHTVDPNLDYAHMARVHDVDGDGNPDIVACARYADAVVWYRMEWESYRGGYFPSGRVCNEFSDYATEHTVCLYGTGFDGADYRVVFWEGDTTQRQTDILTTQNAALRSQYTFVEGRDKPGTWYAGVYPATYVPAYYDPNDSNLIWVDTFEVSLSAIECTVNLDIVPSNIGTVAFEGKPYDDGYTMTKMGGGTYTIEANHGSGYVFSHWEVSGSISVTDTTSAATTCTITGDCTLRMVQTSESSRMPIWFWVFVALAVALLYLGLYLLWRRRSIAGREE